MTSPADARAMLADWVRRYGRPAGEEGPVLFVREVFGVEPDDWQADVLRAYGRGERYLSIRSCHGVGKTAIASWLCWHHLLTRYPQKTAVTAPTKSQLEDALLAEIGRWHMKLPKVLQACYEITKSRVEFLPAPDLNFLSAKTARDENPEALQGIHAENVLLVADEASGVSEKVFEAAIGSMSGEHATTLLLGNPVRTSGYFFNTHHAMRDMWFTMHVTGVPGTAGRYSPRVSAAYVEQVRRTYGEGSNAWRVRALGEFPRADDDTIIPFELIESARNRDIVIPPNPAEIWGLDVARFGGDKNVLVRRSKLALAPKIEAWSGLDLMQTAGRVKRAWDDTAAHLRPERILVDSIGLGAGVVDRLRELNLPVRGVNVSETDGVDGKYRNLRTELWFKGREWLSGRDRALPKSCTCGNCSGDKDHAELLAQELAAQRYAYSNSEGQLMAAPKKQMKKLLGRSPDHADAFLLTFASEPSTLVHGAQASRTNWNEPLRRMRSVV